MERQRGIQKYIGNIFIRPFAVCSLVLFPFVIPTAHPDKLPPPPTTNSESFSLESFQSNYLRQSIVMETISRSSDTTEGPNPALGRFRLTDIVIKGIAGNYSRTGCLGCRDDLLMSNGEPLDDNKLTIAASTIIPLNSPVQVKNMDNGKVVDAVVSDRGGFAKLDRIADLTPAVKNAIGGTDLTEVEITVLKPIPDNP